MIRRLSAGTLVALVGLGGCGDSRERGEPFDGETDAETDIGGETDSNSSDSDSDSAGPTPEDDDDPSAPLCGSEDSNVAGPRLLRRLTTEELTRSVRAAFDLGPDAWAGPSLPPDAAAATGFTNDADRLRVTEAFAVSLQTTAEEVAAHVGEATRLATLVPCSVQGGVDCARTFVTSFGSQLYRRPLSDDEVSRYLELYDEVGATDGFSAFASSATATMLQSPNFIYRSELGEPDDNGGYVLSGYEVASALSYTFTGSPPPDALLELAASGGLQSSDEILEAARELALDSDGTPTPELRARLHAFHRQWLGLSSLENAEKDPILYPGFDDSVKTAMQAELDAFLERVLFEDGGGAAELLTVDHSELDGALASYYGFGQPGEPSMKPDGWGTGILSLGGVLAAHSTFLATSPTQRGYMVRSKLLCQPPPPPPVGVGDLPEPDGVGTTRERYEMHVSDPSCVGCHQLMDPIGFGFEGLDASGRFRDDENGLPIDDSGTVIGLDEESVDFTGPVELANALAGARSVSECVTAQMATFAFGLDPQSTQCIVDGPAEKMANGELGIVDAYVEFAGTRHFLHRE